MKIKTVFFLFFISFVLCLNVNIALGQEEEVASEPQLQWLWGQVVSADTTNQTIVLQYFDYETDQQKEVTITLDTETKLDNTESLSEIKPNDTLSIDYITDASGNNIAKTIGLEISGASEVDNEALMEEAEEQVSQMEEAQMAQPQTEEPKQDQAQDMSGAYGN